jgi:exo-beta-1,3-glucanase (GH17 family)
MKHLSVVTTAVMLLATALAGCASETTGSNATGGVEVNLIIGNTDVTAVNFEVVCDSGMTLSTIMDLSPGDCTITLIALDDAGAVLCTGSKDFTVLVDQTITVDVVLTCEGDGEDPLGNVNVSATFEEVEGNSCPRLHFLNAVPDEVPAEGSAVTVLVSDKDGDVLTTALTATGGSFADPAAQSTTYTCDDATGGQTISVTVTDGDAACDKSKSFEVECAAFELRPLPEIYTTGNAINYGPFRALGPGFGEIPSDDDILEDLGLLNSAGYNLLRLFGADAVSEKILRLAATNFPEMRFQQGLFLEGLSGAAAANCDSAINDSQVATAIQLADTYSSVVTVSVGNETSFFAPFMPLNCLEGYITETRNNVTQPVTADDDYTFYANFFGRSPDNVLNLIDFVSIHTYPFLNYTQWDWQQLGATAGPLRAEAMMEASLAKAQDNYQAVYDYTYSNASGVVTVGETLPIVIGETGWKWRQTNPNQEIEEYAADPVNAKWYYDLMLTWERSPGGPPTIFIFSAFDENWKQEFFDDGWGFWDELRQPNYALCGTPAGSPCNVPVYEGAGYFLP